MQPLTPYERQAVAKTFKKAKAVFKRGRCPEAGRTLLRGGGVERCRYSGLLRAGFAIPNVERRKRFLCWTVQCEFCRYERRFYSRCSE